MSRLKLVTAVLVALLAVSAVASAAASAELPELKSSSFPIKYSGWSGQAKWEAPGGSYFRCSLSGPVEGEVTGVKTLTAVIHFQGCSAGQNVWCTSEGASTGEIVTHPLAGTAVYPPNFNKYFAFVLKPKTGVSLANFKCNGNHEVKGAVIATCYTPRNKPSSTLSLGFVEAGGTQSPNWYYNTEVTPAEQVSASLEATWPSTTFVPLGWEFNTTLELSGGTVEPIFV